VNGLGCCGDLAVSDPQWADWLRDEIGQLASMSTDLTDAAFPTLPFLILTTNYDRLLDRTRGSVDWTALSHGTTSAQWCPTG